jgi:hypothetical protein
LVCLAVALGWGLASGPAEAAGKPSFADLVADLKSPTAKTRLDAVAELGKSRRREAVAPLSALVRDPDLRVRMEVVRAFRELRDLSAVPSLLTSLSDGDPKLREETVGTLVELYAERDRSGPIGALEIFSDSTTGPRCPSAVDPRVFENCGPPPRRGPGAPQGAAYARNPGRTPTARPGRRLAGVVKYGDYVVVGRRPNICVLAI